MKGICTIGLLCAGLILPGCNDDKPADQSARDESQQQQGQPPSARSEDSADRDDVNMPESETKERGDPPSGDDRPSTAQFRFVGRWASETSRCEAAAWRFSPSGLETPAGSVCRFHQVREVPGGYDIDARCVAEGPETRETLRLRFPESAGGMLFEADSIADAGLVKCA